MEVVSDCHKPEFSRLSTYKEETLCRLLGPVFQDLTLLEKQLINLLETESETAKSIVRYFFEQKGKRIRPALFFYLCQILKIYWSS